jgi:hypothetical protein
VEIPYRNGKNYVRKSEGRSYLECLDSRWGVEKGNLGNGLGDCLQNQYFPLEWGEIQDKWCSSVLKELLR